MTEKEYQAFLDGPIGTAIIAYLTEFAEGDSLESLTKYSTSINDVAVKTPELDLLRKHYRAILGMRDDLLDVDNFSKRINE